jgi:hypothetical protein
VVGDDVGFQTAWLEQPEKPQRDVDDDLDVDPGVVRHPEPVRGHLGGVPPGLELVVLVDGVEQSLELAVPARRRLDPGGLRSVGR